MRQRKPKPAKLDKKLTTVMEQYGIAVDKAKAGELVEIELMGKPREYEKKWFKRSKKIAKKIREAAAMAKKWDMHGTHHWLKNIATEMETKPDSGFKHIDEAFSGFKSK